MSITSLVVGMSCVAMLGGSPGGQGGVRWTDSAWWQKWIADSIAIGDGGATMVVGRELIKESMAVYAGGSSKELFEVPYSSSVVDVYVAAADHDSLVASMVMHDVDPGPGYEFAPRIEAYRGNSPTPLWSKDLPGTMPLRFRAGIGVSRAGDRIVGAWYVDKGKEVRVEALAADGSRIAGGSFPVKVRGMTSLHLSADGSRALVQVLGEMVVWDVLGAREEARYPCGSVWESGAISADGNRVAMGYWDAVQGWVEVYERAAAGQWSRILRDTFAAGTIVTFQSLDADGDRLALLLQDTADQYFEVHLIDVDADQEVFQHRFAAPGTQLQLFGSGVEVDDTGRIVGGISWGDDENKTPEVYRFDESGALTVAVDLPGSGLRMDMDPTGELIAVNGRTNHASRFGGGSEVHLVEAPQELHVFGAPRLGQPLSLTLEDQGAPTPAWLAVAADWREAPAGSWQVDWSQLLTLAGPLTIPAGGLRQVVSVPGDPALDGMGLTLQAALQDPGGLRLSNKVVLRLLQ